MELKERMSKVGREGSQGKRDTDKRSESSGRAPRLGARLSNKYLKYSRGLWALALLGPAGTLHYPCSLPPSLAADP